MYRDLRISVVLPCRNEAGHLKEVLSKVPKIVDEIVVVSNNSKDNTVAVAKKLGAKAYEDNRVISGIGYGFAHITGIANATGDIIVGADGDATYPLEELPNIIDRIIDEKLDFVSCNRYPLKDGTKIPFKLRAGVWMLNAEVRLLYGVKINDILSGMWVFKSDLKNQLDLTMGDWNLSPEIKINAATNPAIAFSEHSIVQHRRMGESHQKYFKTGFDHLVWIFKNKFMRPGSANSALDKTES